MEKIVWSNSLSVEVPEIDRQHKQLVFLLNQLIENENLSVRSEIISELLSKMTEYADQHFSTEEALMQACDYPDFEAHQRQHAEFMRRTAQFSLAAMDHDQKIPSEILLYLKNWLIEHIQKTDMQYKPYLSGKSIPQ